jgi:hypothetical protein
MMKSRARATATGVSVGLTIGALVGACTSLPEITAAPTDAGTETSADVGSATDAGDPALSAACKTFLAANGPPGRWAFGPVAGSAVTYVESDKGVPEIAWVGMCEGADKPTVYRTPLDGFAPSKDAITRFPAGDLCVGAKQFGPAIAVQGLEDIVTLIPSDRTPSFLCALVTGNGGVAPPFGLSRVACFGSDPTVKAPEPIQGTIIGLFRSKEFGRSTIRGAFAGADLSSRVNTFVASEGTGGVVFSPTIEMAQKAPEGATAAIATTGSPTEDSFVLFDQSTAVLTRYASNGTKTSDYPTAANIPKALLWGETVFSDANDVLIAGLEGPLDNGLRPRVSLFVASGPSSPGLIPPFYQPVTDLGTASGRSTYGLESGGFERLVMVPGTNAAGTGAAIVAVRGVSKGTPISALVLAKQGLGGLLPSATNSVKIPALPTRYGLAGRIPTTTGGKPSIYVGISADAMAGWSKGVCTSGMIAAFEPQ